MDDRANLMDAITKKETDLKDAVQSFRYLSDAAEARDWIEEKMKATDADVIGSGTVMFYLSF